MSGLAVSLARPLPLRRTTQWRRYREVATLPHAYGPAVTLPALRYQDSDWTVFAVDHHCPGLLAVERGGQIYNGATLRNAVDDTGHPVALLDLRDKVEEGEVISITLQGKLDARGVALTNPADVLQDIFRLAGASVSRGQLDPLRFEAAREGLTVAGALIGYSSGAAVIQSICNSIGARWSRAMPDVARLYPVAEMPPGERLWDEFDDLDLHEFRCEVQRDLLVTVAPVAFDYDWSATTYRQAITLTSSVVDEFGEILPEGGQLEAPWLRSARVAERVFRRWLRYYSRRVVIGAGPIGARGLRLPPLGWVSIAQRHWPAASEAVVVSTDMDLVEQRGTLEVEGVLGPPPTVALTRQSVLQAGTSSGVSVAYQDNVATVRAVYDDTGEPIAEARVVLNGVERRANSNGEAIFTIQPGTYRLEIYPPRNGTPIIIDQYQVGQ